jgi:hypothetical protein
MSDTPDLTPDAVERLAAHIQKMCGCALGANAEQSVAATLRALSAALATERARADAWLAEALDWRAQVGELSDALKAAEAKLATARDDALEEAARCCDAEADKCDDAVKWGGAPKYITACKNASFAMRDRAAAIRALKEPTNQPRRDT